MLAVTPRSVPSKTNRCPAISAARSLPTSDRLRRVAVREQHGELVAAEPAEDVVAAQPPRIASAVRRSSSSPA